MKLLTIIKYIIINKQKNYIMKKLLTIILILFGSLAFFTSCEEETISQPSQNCNCGTVVDWGQDGAYYYVKGKNYCSGSYEWLRVSYSDWYYSSYGDEVCASGSWKSTEEVSVSTTGNGVEKENSKEFLE